MDKSSEERLLPQEEVNVGTPRTKVDLKSRAWTELKLIMRIAFPGMISRVTSFGLIVMTQLFIGHVSELDLAAFALEQSILLQFVNGILLGMASATQTLCGQAFGARQYHMLGVYLQRSWIVDGITATLLLPFFIFTTPILRLIGQEEAISVEAGVVSLWFIPFLYSLIFSFTIQMYLQAQMKNKIIGWFTAPSFFFHVFLSWLLVIKLQWGVPGAMSSFNISSWLVVIAEFVYIFGGWCGDTWKGFTKAAFYDIFPVVKLSLSSGLMICLELWYTSILVLLAGYMKNATVAISAFSICLNINAWLVMVCLGFLAAASVRVSNELGKGDAKAAKFAAMVIISTSVSVGVLFWVVWIVFHQQISLLFTSDEDVAAEVSNLSILLSFTVFLNSIQTALNGIAIGAGVQSWIAFANLGSYYMIGVPCGILLGYVANLQVKGLWIGLLMGIVTQILIVAVIIWRIDWDDQVEKASQRLNRWLLESEESNSSNDNSPA